MITKGLFHFALATSKLNNQNKLIVVSIINNRTKYLPYAKHLIQDILSP